MKIHTIRASAVREVLDCPARFEAKHIRGLRTPSNGKAQLGRAIHRSTGLYDESQISGKGLTVNETAAAVADELAHPTEDVQWDEDLTKPEAERIGIALHEKYCAEVAPSQDYVAVEVTCDRLEIADLGLALTGTTDRVRMTEPGCYGISDLKSGKTAVKPDGTVETAGHAIQIGVYELIAEAGSGLTMTDPARIVGLQTGKTAKAQRVGVGEIVSAREMLIGTPDEPGILEYVSRILHTGSFYGNPSSKMCHESYCPVFRTCRFRK
jgi:hypothetical protein